MKLDNADLSVFLVTSTCCFRMLFAVFRRTVFDMYVYCVYESLIRYIYIMHTQIEFACSFLNHHFHIWLGSTYWYQATQQSSTHQQLNITNISQIHIYFSNNEPHFNTNTASTDLRPSAHKEFVNLSLSKINFHRRTEITAKNWQLVSHGRKRSGSVKCPGGDVQKIFLRLKGFVSCC